MSHSRESSFPGSDETVSGARRRGTGPGPGATQHRFGKRGSTGTETKNDRERLPLRFALGLPATSPNSSPLFSSSFSLAPLRPRAGRPALGSCHQQLEHSRLILDLLSRYDCLMSYLIDEMRSAVKTTPAAHRNLLR